MKRLSYQKVWDFKPSCLISKDAQPMKPQPESLSWLCSLCCARLPALVNWIRGEEENMRVCVCMLACSQLVCALPRWMRWHQLLPGYRKLKCFVPESARANELLLGTFFNKRVSVFQGSLCDDEKTTVLLSLVRAKQ